MWAWTAYAAGVLLLGSRPCLGASSAETAAVPSSVPSDSSTVVDPSFPGFAFEEASFYLYATDKNGAANKFSQNLIHDVVRRTGGSAMLRVGGTSGDYASYTPTQKAPAVPDGRTNPPFTGSPYLSIGPSFFSAFKNFPGCKYVFMVPLARKNITNTLAWTKQGLDNIPDGALEAVEIGNEPNAYHWWSVQNYTSEYTSFEKQIVAQHPSLGKSPSFQALDYTSANAKAGDLSPTVAFNDGINKTGGVKQVGYHYYEYSGGAPKTLVALQSDIVNHTKVVSHMSVYGNDVEAFRKINPTAPFILSEIGDALGSKGDWRSDIAYDNVLATALWAVDFQMQAMKVGVTRVDFQQIFYPGRSMWQPQDGLVPAGVRPNYYSQPLVADFIGTGGNTRVHELDLKGAAEPAEISGYAAYDGDKLARIALLNMKLWSEKDSGARPVLKITLTGLPAGTLKAKYLTSPQGAYANTTLKYGGQAWQYPSGQPKPATPVTQAFTVKNGKVTVPMDATSAVLLSY